MTTERLTDILNRTRLALLRGDLAALGPLSEDLLICWPSGGVTQDLIDLALENQRLLAAAQRGIRSARQRAEDISNARNCPIYDVGGKRAVLPAPGAPPRRA